MLHGARGPGLVKRKTPLFRKMKTKILAEFTSRFYETQLFWDKYTAESSPSTTFKAKGIYRRRKFDGDRAVQLLQAQLFIDAAHDCHNKLRGGWRAQ
jgi:hypothetical protein